LRDDEVSIPKPKDAFRILILGDSVAYGNFVPAKKTFSERLENLLQEHARNAEVINAGVPGYTAYNELQYYLAEGREFEPDVVIVAFCMNDVANPRLHWRLTKDTIINIPEEAIPNHAYDLNHALPRLQKQGNAQNSALTAKSILEHSQLYDALGWRVASLFRNEATGSPGAGVGVPTYITGEDTLSIEVLVDTTSPEWRWLTSIYGQLDSAVRAGGATFVVALFPLAYQLDENYPFFPQNGIAEYCRDNSILCVDLLASFLPHPKEDVFLLSSRQRETYDIWHLTEYGHELAAEELFRVLQERNLIAKEG